MAKIFQGIVKSTKTKDTAIVEVERFYVHPLYEKRVKRSKGYAVHIETEVNVGDTVRFVETRPISKTKRWKVTEILSNGKTKKVAEAGAEPKAVEGETKKPTKTAKKGAKAK